MVKQSGSRAKPIVFGVIGVIVLLLGIVWFARSFTERHAPQKSKYEFQNGMCYVTWNKDRYLSEGSDASLEEMARTGTEWVALTINWYQDKCYTTSIFSTEKTPSDLSLIHAIDKIHSLGMKVLLKPHLDLLDTSGGSWRGEIACARDTDWDAWFDSYGDFITHYARMAQEHDVELFCIGTELTSVATIKESLWKTKVIKPVRDVYKGPLTYAANWNEEYTHVKFWDEMDYVGIDAYFPLSEKDSPSLDELREGWKHWVEEIEAFQAKVNKPIIFPEVGYCSAKGTAKMPWEDLQRGDVDLRLQADCYQTLLEAFWDKDWFYGVYWWRWGTDVKFGGPLNRGYSLQNKPAEHIIREWYSKPTPVRNRY